MADHSTIEWTNATWNPIRGCSRVSEGCRHCYAETIAARFSGPGLAYEGLAKRVGGEARWTNEVHFVEDHLTDPLRWKRPRRIFVNSMSDLFHEKVPDAWIDRIFAVMALAPQHTFQVLTKRPKRMRAYAGDPGTPRRIGGEVCDFVTTGEVNDVVLIPPGIDPSLAPQGTRVFLDAWPLPNVWLGVSTEDQATADERIPILLDTPAAMRWISAEPLLGPIDLEYLAADGITEIKAISGQHIFSALPNRRRLDWVVVGGESGRRARPMELAWARSLISQCRAAEVPAFMKQLGAANGLNPHNRKGGDWMEWAEDLRVRQFPEGRSSAPAP